jgi:hypothetical protein
LKGAVLPFVGRSKLKAREQEEGRIGRYHSASTYVRRRADDLRDGELRQPDDDEKDEQSTESPTD